jgi:osmoprotectant transport system permease protein
VHFLAQVAHWFTTSAHWHGVDGIPHRVWEHLQMSGAATFAAAAIALPIGIGLGHRGKGGNVAVNVSNIGRAVPSFALLFLAAQAFHRIGAIPSFVTLVALAVPPMMTNSYAGIRGVDPELREASIGMGMTGIQTLFRVELPVALPLVMAGIRTSAVQVVATATLAALIAWGGLGRFITEGIANQDNVEIFSGALLVALLSLGTEVGLAALQRWGTPNGLKLPDSVKNEPFAGAADALRPVPHPT